MSTRLVDGLVLGKETLPQFSETRQRVLSTNVDVDEGKPQRLTSTEGTIWIFDHEGGIQAGLREAFALTMELMPTPKKDATVVELRPRVKKNILEEEFRWEPGKHDIERVVADIWPKQKSDRLKALNSNTKRKPPLTYEARRAIGATSEAFWKIPYEIEKLKEPSLRSFMAEARHRSNHDPDFSHLYRAIADMAEWQLEIEKRRRTGKGVWYAVVEVMMWRDGVGEAVSRYYERCSNRDDAVAAARCLLAKHAHEFSDMTTVEAELLTDLEWNRRDYSD